MCVSVCECVLAYVHTHACTLAFVCMLPLSCSLFFHCSKYGVRVEVTIGVCLVVGDAPS